MACVSSSLTCRTKSNIYFRCCFFVIFVWLEYLDMKRTIIEKLIIVIAWVGVVGGILFSILYSKGILESGADMSFPTGIACLLGGVFASVCFWAVLLELISISDRLNK